MIILGHKFEIIYTDDLEDGVHGDCCAIKKRIRISSRLDEEERLVTLFHELMHAVLGISGLSQILDEKVEEAVVVSLENGLLPILTGWKDLVVRDE